MKLPINIKFSDTAQQMTQVVLPERWLRYDYITLTLFAAGLVGYCALLASVMFDLGCLCHFRFLAACFSKDGSDSAKQLGDGRAMEPWFNDQWSVNRP